MKETYSICGYTRISVDLEEDRDNTSIENQKSIIEDYVRQTFPDSTLDLYVDRDRSGYTFTQREQYQIMRTAMLAHKYDILIVKDLSRFSRRNSYGLVELETLRDAGIRIIAIGDNIDYPTNDDWLRIQIYFFMNEMPVTDTSKKVRNVIKRRQADGKWICSVPYGYRITNTKTMSFEVDEPAADIVRKAFDLYNSGWGYKRISNWLTEQHIPTPRMNEIAYKRSRGEDTKLHFRDVWSVATVQGILDNDFYIGTLRQGKYTRKTINGVDMKIDETEHKVFEHNHEAIVPERTFAITKELRKQRTRSNYRGIKKFENAYSGLIYCGDCGSPMFSMSRADLKPAYICGAYHRRGRNGCTSHHTLVSTLDAAVKHSIAQVKENAESMMEYLQKSIEGEEAVLSNNRKTAVSLEEQLERLQNELKATKSQKIRDCLRHPENTEVIEETYDAIESELTSQIAGLKNQIRLSGDTHNTTIQINRTAKTVFEVFDRILNANSIAQDDLNFVVERITVFDDAIEVTLKSDVKALLCFGVFSEADIPKDAIIVQESTHRHTKELKMLVDATKTDNVISNGDPLEIFTDERGGVILKKYFPLGEFGSSAETYAEALQRVLGHTVVVADKEQVLACVGALKRELAEKPLHKELIELLSERQSITLHAREQKMLPVVREDGIPYTAQLIVPILSAGELVGAVLLLSKEPGVRLTETEEKVCKAVADCIGQQIEL